MSRLEEGCGAGFVCFEPFCCKYKEKHDGHLLNAIFSVPREVGVPVTQEEYDEYRARVRHALPTHKRPLFEETVSSPDVLQNARAFGFKVRPDYVPSLTTDLVLTHSVRIISIIRENPVKAALAELRRLGGLGQFTNKSVVHTAVAVDPQTLLNATKHVAIKKESIRALTGTLAGVAPTMNVTYEQLVASPTAVTATACALSERRKPAT